MKDNRLAKAGDDPWLDLVVSILAVNNASLEKTFGFGDAFRKHGLLDPQNLAAWDQEKIANEMKIAGFDRGDFMTNLFAVRLAALGQVICQAGFEASTKLISGTDRRPIEKFLGPIHGIGPRVLNNFFTLRGI